MRYLVALSLLFAASCSPGNDNAADQNMVDIGLAAKEAQGSIDAYANTTADRAPATSAPERATPAPEPATSAPEPAPGAVATPAPLTPPAPGEAGGLPDDRTPVSEGPFTPDSAQGAANVVQTYYALLGEGKYRQAWALWGDGGKASGMSAPAFAASFDKYSEYHANIGAPGRIDAGAGQRHVTVPVQVYARLKQRAAPVYMIGSVTLHRSGNIDGATAAQTGWHIRSADIKTHRIEAEPPMPAEGPREDRGQLPSSGN